MHRDLDGWPQEYVGALAHMAHQGTKFGHCLAKRKSKVNSLMCFHWLFERSVQLLLCFTVLHITIVPVPFERCDWINSFHPSGNALQVTILITLLAHQLTVLTQLLIFLSLVTFFPTNHIKILDHFGTFPLKNLVYVATCEFMLIQTELAHLCGICSSMTALNLINRTAMKDRIQYKFDPKIHGQPYLNATMSLVTLLPKKKRLLAQRRFRHRALKVEIKWC